MKKLSIGIFAVGMALFLSQGCKKDDSSSTPSASTLQTAISGYAEKGVFLPGATVTVNVYKDRTFSDILNTYQTTIASTDGSYKVTGDVKSPYVVVKVQGIFVDETTASGTQISGEVSAVADASSGANVNVNAITDIEKGAAIAKMKASTTTTIADAKKGALDDVLMSLGLTKEEADSIKEKGADKVRLGDGSKGGDALLKVSASLIKAANGSGKDFKDYTSGLRAAVASKTADMEAKLGDIKAKKAEVDGKLEDIRANLQGQRNAKAIRAALTTNTLEVAYIEFLGTQQGEPNFTMAQAELKRIQPLIKTTVSATLGMLSVAYGLPIETQDKVSAEDILTIKRAISAITIKTTDKQKTVILGRHIHRLLGNDEKAFLCVTKDGVTYLYFPTIPADKLAGAKDNFKTKLGLVFEETPAPAQVQEEPVTAIAQN